ncbi:hypothetical protein FRX31_022463, partial [Thalictrum thalictroides]
MLKSIGHGLGNFLSIDADTINLTKPDVARICVEMDLQYDLPDSFWLEGHGYEGYWQPLYFPGFLFCGFCSKTGHSLEFCRKKNPALQKEITKNRVPAVNRNKGTIQQPKNSQATVNTKQNEGVYKATGKVFTEIPTSSTFEKGESSIAAEELATTRLIHTQVLQVPQISLPSPMVTLTGEHQPMVISEGKKVEDTQPILTAQSPKTIEQPPSTNNPPLCLANPFAVLDTIEEEDLQITQQKDAPSTLDKPTNTRFLDQSNPSISTPTNSSLEPLTTQKDPSTRTPSTHHSPIPSLVQDISANSRSITPNQKKTTSSPNSSEKSSFPSAGFLDKAFASDKNPLG